MIPGPAPLMARAAALPGTVVLIGRLIEDRTPAATPPAAGTTFARVPRQVPWLDLFFVILIVGTTVSLLQRWFGFPVWLEFAVVLLILLVPLMILGFLRRFQPERFQRLRDRLIPIVGRRVPEIRRIVVQGEGGDLIGVELAHPSRWPPTRAWPADGGLRIRCEGAWVELDRLFRAEKLTVVDDQGVSAGQPARARAWQTFSLALGVIALLMLAIALVLRFLGL